MTDAVLLAAALLAGATLASPFAYIAGRRSSREELAGAQRLIEAMNAAPARDALADALPPERSEPEEDPAPPSWQHDGERAITEPCESCGGVGNLRLTDGDAATVLCHPCATAAYPMFEVLAGVGLISQEPPDLDDTWQGTLSYLQTGEWAPAAPAPKRVGS